MPKYIIVEVRKDLFYVYYEREIIFKSHSLEACKNRVDALECYELLKECMSYY